ncbi:Similar to FAS1: Fasciclin-1 (Schistocerca americana) [Cotesia congregata]|uniref:Similar to FAS1: Fasciclin-1 (Schistocerca americana) n=1 Tax=Cotesia congregata TaxID=51543 RepID=A0A8J2H3Q8_COTCN|nr:Similar to FAS1: Fasciclin-1 (Schistocerca americana) [Cotesia congregata]
MKSRIKGKKNTKTQQIGILVDRLLRNGIVEAATEPSRCICALLYLLSANLPKTTDELGDTISSELEGNPPLWVTRKRGYPQDEIYINNAKILDGSNYRSKIHTSNGEKIQVLHKISEVLEPVLSNSPDSLISNPNAFQFLNQSDSINLGQFRIRTFRQRVLLNNKEDIFKAEGGYTFFIPDEEGFKPSVRPTKIDHQVIDGHVIPNHVLFTAPTPNDRPYNTLANTDNFKVTISFVRDPDNSKKMYVKSNTLVGDATHPTGVVLAEIVKANIPVKNGVVHLIQRPLMVVDTTVQQFLAVSTNLLFTSPTNYLSSILCLSITNYKLHVHS